MPLDRLLLLLAIVLALGGLTVWLIAGHVSTLIGIEVGILGLTLLVRHVLGKT